MNVVSRYPSGAVMVSWAQAEGLCRRENNQSCDDTVFLCVTPDYLFCGLADGQSGARYGGAGGRICLEAISDYISSIGVGNFIDAPFPDEHPCTLTKIYRQKLLHLSESKAAPMKEFASTLLAIAVDLNTGKFALLHLGDGCAVGIPHSGDPTLISSPENGLSLCHTWLTTSENAVSHFRIRFGSLENKKRILILSDGATCLCKGRNIPWRAKKLMKYGGQTELLERLILSKPADDATCILLECRNEESRNSQTCEIPQIS